MAINAGQGLNGGGIVAADQHPIGIHQIGDRGALRQELRIGEHRKGFAAASSLGGRQDRLHRLRRAHRQGALLHHDRVALGAGRHLPGRDLDPTQVTGLASPHAPGLGGGIHREKHHVGLGNGRLYLGSEKEVAAPAATHHQIEPWLIDRQPIQIRIVPGGNASGVEIHHRDTDLGTAIGDHRHGGTAHIAGTDTADREYLISHL